MQELKLSVLLAKTDALGQLWKAAIRNYTKFFSGSQGAFMGEKRTYTPAPDTVDIPKNRNSILVQSTVDEKLKYFQETQKDYLDALFSQEATNASGTARAELIVDGKSWGEFSSLELLRMKSIVGSQDFKQMHASIPVRSDAVIWEDCTEDLYIDRDIVQTQLQESTNKTTEKESYILTDPNIERLTGSKSYTPQIGQKNTTVILGQGTHQVFSGEWSQRQKAHILRKISLLEIGIIEALKNANDTVVIESALDANKLFEYLHK